MFYSLNREGADQAVLDTLIQEVDDVLQGGQPTYETYKQQKFAEAWYVLLSNYFILIHTSHCFIRNADMYAALSLFTRPISSLYESK
jgi:hypothetical protein